MHPVLFHLGGWQVTAYATFHVLGAAVAVAATLALAHRRGLPARRVGAVVALTVPAVLVGARALHVVLNRGWYAESPGRALRVAFTGFAMYGGLALGAVTCVVAARRAGLDRWRLADVAVVGGALGLAVVRVGCFLNGCCYGEPTGLAWGVTYPTGSAAWAHFDAPRRVAESGVLGLVSGGDADHTAVHPTQLYELAAALVVATLAWRLGRRASARPGVATLAAAAAFSAARLAVWTVRVPASTFDGPTWFWPVAYSVLILGALALARRHQVPGPPWGRARSPRAAEAAG